MIKIYEQCHQEFQTNRLVRRFCSLSCSQTYLKFNILPEKANVIMQILQFNRLEYDYKRDTFCVDQDTYYQPDFYVFADNTYYQFYDIKKELIAQQFQN